MKLYMEQQIFTLTDTFDIYNENNEQAYYAKADFFTFGHQVPVYKNDEQIGEISQQFALFRPTFSIYHRNEYLGNIIKEISFFSQYYTLEYNNWRVEGDWFAHEYQVYDEHNNVVMYLDKEWFTWGDAYCLNIVQEEYEEICVMIAIAIDVAICSQKS